MNDAMLAALLDRPYDRRTYNCTHFAVDVWQAITGEDIGGFLVPERAALAHRHSFRRVRKPVWSLPYPLLVLMRRATENHIGVYYRGKVWHKHAAGAECLPPETATLAFKDVRYYAYE